MPQFYQFQLRQYIQCGNTLAVYCLFDNQGLIFNHLSTDDKLTLISLAAALNATPSLIIAKACSLMLGSTFEEQISEKCLLQDLHLYLCFCLTLSGLMTLPLRQNLHSI